MKIIIDEIEIYPIFSKMINTYFSKTLELYFKDEIRNIYIIFLFDLNNEIEINLVK